MRRFALLLAGFLGMVLPMASHSGDTAKSKCLPVHSINEKSLAFQDGERLNFVVHYKWGIINSDVGKGYFRVDTTVLNGTPVFHCSAGGRSAKFYDVFFKVREDFQSWLTVDALKPLTFYRDTYEGGYRAQNTYTFDWTPGAEKIDAAIYTSKKGNYSAEIPLDNCTLDLPSLICMMRNLDLSALHAGDRYPMTLAINDSSFNIHFIYEGKDEKRLDGNKGKVKCHKFAVGVVAGEVFSGDADMYLWLSDDDNRIPVWFVAPILYGEVQGRLTGYSGLKHAFKALVR